MGEFEAKTTVYVYVKYDLCLYQIRWDLWIMQLWILNWMELWRKSTRQKGYNQ